MKPASQCLTAFAPVGAAGVLLGDDKLTGLDIGLVLPAMRQRPLSALFLPDFGTNPASMAPKARGGLKERKSERTPAGLRLASICCCAPAHLFLPSGPCAHADKGPVRERRPGPVNVVTTTHLTDGRPLQLTAQVSACTHCSHDMHLVWLHPAQPMYCL